MNHHFEFAPPVRSTAWGQAFAFSLAPAVATGAAIYAFQDSLVLALSVAGAGLLGAMLFGIVLVRPYPGRLVISDEALQVESGLVLTAIPLVAIDQTGVRLGWPESEGAEFDLRVVTDPSQVVTIPLRAGGWICVSPLEATAFVEILKTVPAAV